MFPVRTEADRGQAPKFAGRIMNIIVGYDYRQICVPVPYSQFPDPDFSMFQVINKVIE